jgi:hypothetical protein
MKNRKGTLEISFGWLFAILAGLFILFLAVYFSSRIINTQQNEISAQTGKEIGILLNPLETSFESAQTTSITIPSETRINGECTTSGDFGKQIIRLDQKSFGEWKTTDVFVSFENKYIFSEESIEGKKFYLFSKPFEMPFKIADIVYMTSADDVYCFVDAPEDIAGEIRNLNQDNLIANESRNCMAGEISVCFGSGSCNISVDYGAEIVNKRGESINFAGDKALMYAAIFSGKESYECQTKRLTMRLEKLAELYREKELMEVSKGCDNNLEADLSQLGSSALQYSDSEDLRLIVFMADDIERKNKARRCLLW